MKKIIALLTLFCSLAFAAPPGQRVLTQNTSFTAATNGTSIAGTGALYHQISWTIRNAALNTCNVKVESSANGTYADAVDLIAAVPCWGARDSSYQSAQVYTATAVANLRVVVTAFAGSGRLDVTYSGYAEVVGPTSSTSTITNDTTTNATMYPTWVTATSGHRPLKVSSTKMSFNPSAGLLTATGFSGPLVGNVTGNVSGSAATLATPRAIYGNNFDGSAALTGPATIATSLTVPVVIGGTAANSTLRIYPTSGTGNGTEATIIGGGTNGGTQIGSFMTSGIVLGRGTGSTPTAVGIGGTATQIGDYYVTSQVNLLSIQSASDSRTLLELANTYGIDSAGFSAGVIEFSASSQSAGYKDMGYLTVAADGGTANKRASVMNFAVRTDNVTGDPVVRLAVKSTAIVMSSYGAGTATFDANGVISSVSDERMKDIQGPLGAGLSEILKVNPILYKHKASSGLDELNVYAGFSAQNVMQYIPEAVGKNRDGFYSFNDRPVIAALVNAVKELHAEIAVLRAGQIGAKADSTHSTAVLAPEERILLAAPLPVVVK